MLRRAAEIHSYTSKPNDIFWNRWVMRPVASLMLVGIERTPATPNQITFLSLAIFVFSAATLAFWPGAVGLAVGVALLQVSYALDCADGQLARLKGLASPVGAHLDFTMDEIKALVLMASVTLRLGTQAQAPLWVFSEGLIGVAIAGSGLSLTTLMRRAEFRKIALQPIHYGAGDYGDGFASVNPTQSQANCAPPRSGMRVWLGSLTRLLEKGGKFAIHYPSHITVFALIGQMDWFVHLMVLAYSAHTARAFLTVVKTLGVAQSPDALSTNQTKTEARAD